jgi:hypothetical protein
VGLKCFKEKKNNNKFFSFLFVRKGKYNYLLFCGGQSVSPTSLLNTCRYVHVFGKILVSYRSPLHW